MVTTIMACCATNLAIVQMVSAAAQKHGIPEEYLHAVVIVESRYDTKAVNNHAPVKSYGIGQLTKVTAEFRCDLDFEDILEPELNIDCSAKVLALQLRRYQQDADKAFSAYNAGTYTLKNKQYVQKVRTALRRIYEERNRERGPYLVVAH